MGWIGEAIGTGLGAGIGSIWGEKNIGGDVGGKVGKWLPFKKGGQMRSYKTMLTGKETKPKKKKFQKK